MDNEREYDVEIKLPVEIEQYERKIYGLKQLIEIGKGLNSTLDYNVLIESILLTCMGQMQLFQVGIFLKKGLDLDIYILHRNYKGFDLDHSVEYEIHSNSRLIRFLEEHFRCYTLEELNEIVGPGEESMRTLNRIAPMLVVPVMGKGKLNGIIILGERINKQHFSESEKEYLLNISSLAGIAIQNAYLYEMATTDMMTKLKLHHYFQAALSEEREKSYRKKIPLSVLLMDIDHFKQVNDTYGHTCGDEVLKAVSKILVDNIRQIDIAARYGGEEFAVILPGTVLEDALSVAERIRKSIEGFEFECNGKRIGVRVSLGVTLYEPNTDIDNKTLIDRADRALYRSKQQGRNRVSFL